MGISCRINPKILDKNLRGDEGFWGHSSTETLFHSPNLVVFRNRTKQEGKQGHRASVQVSYPIRVEVGV